MSGFLCSVNLCGRLTILSMYLHSLIFFFFSCVPNVPWSSWCCSFCVVFVLFSDIFTVNPLFALFWNWSPFIICYAVLFTLLKLQLYAYVSWFLSVARSITISIRQQYDCVLKCSSLIMISQTCGHQLVTVVLIGLVLLW